MDWQNIDQEFQPMVKCSDQNLDKYYFVFAGEQLLAKEGQSPYRPLQDDELRNLGLDEDACHYLGEHRAKACYALDVVPLAAPQGYTFITMWNLLGQVDSGLLNLAGRAKQVVDWHRNHQFCGRCGKKTQAHSLERSRVCDDCRLFFFPRLAPSIIVLVTRGEEVLLARGHNMPEGFYSTLAGFVEAGESIEQAVHREVFEEVGIKVKNLKYFDSQPWPFPNSLMLGFHAEYESGEIDMQQEEIVDAQWFRYDALPNKPLLFSISGWLIDHYVKKCESTQ